MNIKFPPLINVDGDLTTVSTFGRETVMLEISLKNKAATITMSRSEALALLNGLKQAGVGAELQSVGIPQIALPRKV